MNLRPQLMLAAVAAVSSCGLRAQVIQFESGGLKYQSLSHDGITVMFAHLPMQLRKFAILQLAVANGSELTFTIRPEDVSFKSHDRSAVQAEPARAVVSQILSSAGRHDVINLISAYEASLYGLTKFRSTNGYEQRRQAFFAETGSSRLNAAAAASAIAFVETRLTAGQSTDGALFFPTAGKPLGTGKITVRAAGRTFEFESEPEGTSKTLHPRGETPPQR